MESKNGYFDFPSPVPLVLEPEESPPPPVPPFLLLATPAAVSEVSPLIMVPEAVFAGPITTPMVFIDTLSDSLQ